MRRLSKGSRERHFADTEQPTRALVEFGSGDLSPAVDRAHMHVDGVRADHQQLSDLCMSQVLGE